MDVWRHKLSINFCLSLAQEECGSSREDVVEDLLVILREEELLKTRYSDDLKILSKLLSYSGIH